MNEDSGCEMESDDSVTDMLMNGATALIIDDSATIQALLRAMLEAEGLKVRSLLNGSDAVAQITAQQPNLILLDNLLPGLNGMQILELIQARSELRKIPVIMITGCDGDDVVTEALNRGAVDYIRKPFSRKVVIARVHAALRAQRLTGQLVSLNDSLRKQIRDRKRVERDLWLSKERYALAVDAGKVGLWEWSIATDDFYLATNLQAMLGLQLHDLPPGHESWLERIHPDDREESRRLFEACASGTTTNYDHQVRYCHVNGSVRWFLSRASVISDADGHPIRVLGADTDITEQKQSEVELFKAKEDADRANRMKAAFLANMSHEIRTPMAAVLGYTELLEQTSLDEEQADALSVIARNGRHLLDLINDILDISKIEADQLEVERIHVSPLEIVRDVEALLSHRASEKGLQLQVVVEDGIPNCIQTDPTRLRQVLINLVGNAIKFTESGRVELAMRMIQQEERDLIQFTVTDTGIGMTEEQTQRIFEPFVQAEQSTNRQFGGTGLGLSIGRRLATMLGGDLWVTSEPRVGSVFGLNIDPGSLAEATHSPQLVQRGAGAKIDEVLALEDGKSARVLYAEDSVDSQRLCSHIMRKAGFEVSIVDNGLKAVEQALAAAESEQPFDVILMDMQMPVLDGYEATRRLRDAGYTRPIIAFTASAMDGDVKKCLDAGCDDYATKPIDRAHLLQLVLAQVSNRPAPSVAAQ